MDPTQIMQWMALVQAFLTMLQQLHIFPPYVASHVAAADGSPALTAEQHALAAQYALAAHMASAMMK